jgi:hypothetical protein
MSSKRKITSKEFCSLFGLRDPRNAKECAQYLKGVNTVHHQARQEELREYFLFVLKRINEPFILRSRRQNLSAFEKGWGENLRLLESGKLPGIALKPKYFKPSKFLRYKGELVVSSNLNLEYELFTAARNLLFKNYLAPYHNIYELGCGSSQNLLLLSEIFPEKELWGLDWARSSVRIIEFLAKKFNKNIKGRVFDMARPKTGLAFKPGSALFTVHSLEQLGGDFEKLVSTIISAKPAMVMHYEPIQEFYKANDWLDQLALAYSGKRNYLNGFYTYLLKLEKSGKIKIIAAKRPFLGGVIHEASLIIWKPI